MFKVGDEVLVKAKIKEVATDDERLVRLEGMGAYWFIPTDKTYSDGLSDAWELAKKIATETKDGGIPCDDMCVMFGTDIIPIIFENFTFEDCRDKIEAYEKEKEIKVKTIVETHDGSHKGVVTLVREKGDFFVLWDNGTSDTYEKHEVKNTGKTAESLDLLLRQIGE